MTYEADTIIKRAKLIADDLESRMEYWADKASEEHWDGRDLLVGPLFHLIRVARALGLSKAQVKAIIDNTDAFDAGGKVTRDSALLVSPGGRPLAHNP